MKVDYSELNTIPPPYTPREKPARWVRTHEYATLRGAEKIGSILIQASNRKNAENVAPVEAAKFGADFYDLHYSSSHITGKGIKIGRDSYTRGSRTDVGGRTKITTTTVTPVDRSLKGFWCDLYRVSPDPKERDLILRNAFNGCVGMCKGTLGFSSACSSSTLKKYLAKGVDPNPDLRIPLLYHFINCVGTDPYNDNYFYENNYEKLRILLDAGADPNMLIKEDVSEDHLEYYAVLKNYRKPYPSVLKIVRDTIMVRTKDLAKLEQEPRKKSEYNDGKTNLDFLKKIEALLVEKGARIH